MVETHSRISFPPEPPHNKALVSPAPSPALGPDAAAGCALLPLWDKPLVGRAPTPCAASPAAAPAPNQGPAANQMLRLGWVPGDINHGQRGTGSASAGSAGCEMRLTSPKRRPEVIKGGDGGKGELGLQGCPERSQALPKNHQECCGSSRASNRRQQSCWLAQHPERAQNQKGRNLWIDIKPV